jgi:predicted DNA-binding transcriptional regulator AlpA
MVLEPTWRYLTRDEVCELRGVRRTKQYEDEKAERFPPGERHGMRTIRWRSDVVAKWMEDESQRKQAASADMLKRQSESAAIGVEKRREKRAASANELASQA